MEGAFNLFQATMLRWRSRHPYNATHEAFVPHALDAARLRATLAAALEETGLTGYALDAARGRYAWRGGPATVELAIAPPPAEAGEAIRAAIERSLARAFPREGAYVPFAFEAIPSEGGFWLVLVYDHVVAGGDSAAALLGAIAREVVTIERIAHLAEVARARLHRLGYANDVVHHADGSLGWPSLAPYDGIAVAAGAPEVPRALLDQLAIGGRLVIPAGPSDDQRLLVIERRDDRRYEQRDLGEVRFVPVVGAQGWPARS